jgi:hypothetical protein
MMDNQSMREEDADVRSEEFEEDERAWVGGIGEPGFYTDYQSRLNVVS